MTNDKYREYLNSAEWERKRQQILERAQGRCEGCGVEEPREVHHLTYAHIGNEFLFELVGLCTGCHDRLHGHTTERTLERVFQPRQTAVSDWRKTIRKARW